MRFLRGIDTVCVVFKWNSGILNLVVVLIDCSNI